MLFEDIPDHNETPEQRKAAARKHLGRGGYLESNEPKVQTEAERAKAKAAMERHDRYWGLKPGDTLRRLPVSPMDQTDRDD